MKKIVMFLLAGLCIFGITKNVYAEEVYYTTQNGIELTYEEYKFLTSFYGEEYPDIMTKAMYEEFIEDDILDSEIEKVSYNEPQLALLNPSISPRSTIHETSAKTVQIARACTTSFCLMTLQNIWHGSPTIRSWDNIGAFLYNTTLIQHNLTYVYSTSGTTFFYNVITDTNGVGNSVELPSTGNNIRINMTFKVNRGGTVFGSYQHAMQNTTLANSQNYNFDIGGYGGVFDYYGTAIGIYDGMNGVDINV